MCRWLQIDRETGSWSLIVFTAVTERTLGQKPHNEVQDSVVNHQIHTVNTRLSLTEETGPSLLLLSGTVYFHYDHIGSVHPQVYYPHILHVSTPQQENRMMKNIQISKNNVKDPCRTFNKHFYQVTPHWTSASVSEICFYFRVLQLVHHQ